jgi:hypothetical protein
MYAVFGVSEIDTSRLTEADRLLEERLIPGVKQAPGFVSGTWARSKDGKEGRSAIIFESEKAARTALEAALERFPTDGPITLKSASVLEVRTQI